MADQSQGRPKLEPAKRSTFSSETVTLPLGPLGPPPRRVTDGSD